MLSRLSSTLKPSKRVSSLYYFFRLSSAEGGSANYNHRGKEERYRQRIPPRISATNVIVGVAAGTILASQLTSYGNSLDHDDLKDSSVCGSKFSRLGLKAGVVARPKTAMCKTSTTLDQDYESRASDILTFCGLKDVKQKEKVIEEMMHFLKKKEEGSGGTTETERHLPAHETSATKLINDAIHGPIPISPLLYQIINTPEYHRLKNIKQIGGGHYVYPGANHTRFEHSIGVCFVAGNFARHLQRQLKLDRKKVEDSELKKMYKFKDMEVLCAEIAGLCHDLGHGPFSHTFEKVMKEALELEVEHETLSVAIFKRILTNPKVLGEFVYERLKVDHVQLIGNMISPPDPEERDDRWFLYEIVANKLTGIDVDKWDYYQRDCHYLGVLQDFQWRRTMLLGRIVMTPEAYQGKDKLRIGFRDKEMSNLYGMFRTRANIHRKACQHKTVKAVEQMIAEAMALVKDLKLVWVSRRRMDQQELKNTYMCKEEFKSIKEAVKCAVDPQNPQLDWYLAMTDSIVGSIMSANAASETEQENLAKAKELLKRIEERDLYSCSARKRVPEFFPREKFLKDDHPSYNQSKSSDERLIQKKNSEIEAAKMLLKNHTECAKFVKSIHQNLLLEDQSVIKKDDIWVEVVRIKHVSEKTNNPVDEVLFFEKAKTPRKLPTILPKDTAISKASMVVVPQAFVEYELRVYDKRYQAKRNERHQKALENAMNRAWKLLVDEVGSS